MSNEQENTKKPAKSFWRKLRELGGNKGRLDMERRKAEREEKERARQQDLND